MNKFFNTSLLLFLSSSATKSILGHPTLNTDFSSFRLTYNGDSKVGYNTVLNIQSKPYITEIYDNGAKYLDTKQVYDENGNLIHEVDINGYHSEFVYDKIGRIIKSTLPGSFLEDGSADFTTAYIYDDNIELHNFDEYSLDNLNTFALSKFINGKPNRNISIVTSIKLITYYKISKYFKRETPGKS